STLFTASPNHPPPTHRNSLAASTRRKGTSHQTTTSGSETNKPSTSSPPEKQESSRDEKGGVFYDEFGVSNMAMDENAPEEEDDFFEGMAELGESLKLDDAGDSFSDNFQDAMQFQCWLPNNANRAGDHAGARDGRRPSREDRHGAEVRSVGQFVQADRAAAWRHENRLGRGRRRRVVGGGREEGGGGAEVVRGRGKKKE
ncbi:PREDICTED: WRKY transcription factor 22-like, partial [Ipomoea nil]|uniref:WRKY transcription factor 22-like n=1 Tax=Ipomoea nil TaxID=35883 RepID=UPI000901FA98